MSIKAYLVHDPKSYPVPGEITRRELNPDDVDIKIKYCGICHSDLHLAHNDWGISRYPFVGGHEIVGTVTQVGSEVSKFKPGDVVGVGCIVSTCGDCKACAIKEDQWCPKRIGTYNAIDHDGTVTYGGYSERVVVRERCVLKVPSNLDLASAAPLLCAGITSYQPIMTTEIGPKTRVGVAGLGGLGSMAVKLAKAKGAKVTVISRTHKKEKDAQELKADGFIATENSEEVAQHKESLDVIIDTIPVNHDINQIASFLDYGGKLCITGLVGEFTMHTRNLMNGNRSVTASNIGGIRQTQELLDFCSIHNITCDVEVIPFSRIEEAYERVKRGDVHYRFVLDLETI